MVTIKTDEHKFGTICVCALRYAMGRQTYMPELVRDFVRAHLHEIPDETITVMLSDCEFQRKHDDGFQIRRIEIEMPEQAVKIIEAEKKRNEY